jgi:hypothetical protein
VHSSPYVRFRKIEHGPENADIKAAQRSCAENLCNVRVYSPCISALTRHSGMFLAGIQGIWQLDPA